MTVPVIEGWTVNDSGGSTVQSITLTKPSGVSIGDLLLLIVGSDNSNTGDWQDISGWNKIVNYNGTAADAALGIYWRIADGSEDATIIVSQGAGNYDEMYGWYIRISGVDQTTPIHVLGAPANSTLKPFTINQVWTTVDDCLAFYAVAHDGGDAGSFTPTGAGWSEIDEQYSGTGSTDACGAWGVKPMTDTQGGTGSISMTYTGGADGSSYVQFAVAPSLGGPVPVLVSDGLSLSDGIGKERRLTVSDGLGASDGLPLTDRTFSLGDVLDLLDIILKQRDVLPIQDNVTLVDFISKYRMLSTISDSLDLNDNIIRDKTILLINETINLVDALVLLRNLGIIDALNLNDNVVVTLEEMQVQVSDILILTDVILKERNLAIQDVSNLNDNVSKQRNVTPINDVVNLIEALMLLKNLEIIDSLSLSDDVIVIFGETQIQISDLLALTDSVLTEIGLTIQDLLHLTDVILKQRTLAPIEDVVTITDTQYTDKPTLLIIDTVGSSDTVLSDKTFTINDQIEMLDTIKTYSGMGWHGKIYGISNFKDVLNILKERIEKINKVD